MAAPSHLGGDDDDEDDGGGLKGNPALAGAFLRDDADPPDGDDEALAPLAPAPLFFSLNACSLASIAAILASGPPFTCLAFLTRLNVVGLSSSSSPYLLLAGLPAPAPPASST